MEDTYKLHLIYQNNVTSLIKDLEIEIEEINLKLKDDANNSKLLHQLKNANLNLLISQNELEHVLAVLERY